MSMRMFFVMGVGLFAGWMACEPQSTVDRDDFNDRLEENRDACVAKINEYRAKLDLYPLDRWKGGEACADVAAKSDAQKRDPHDSFSSCDELAQNECPGWRSVERVLDGCFEMMWAEGPGEDYAEHGHYTAMTNDVYAEVACGFYLSDTGEVWAVQNFQ